MSDTREATLISRVFTCCLFVYFSPMSLTNASLSLLLFIFMPLLQISFITPLPCKHTQSVHAVLLRASYRPFSPVAHTHTHTYACQAFPRSTPLQQSHTGLRREKKGRTPVCLVTRLSRLLARSSDELRLWQTACKPVNLCACVVASSWLTYHAVLCLCCLLINVCHVACTESVGPFVSPTFFRPLNAPRTPFCT